MSESKGLIKVLFIDLDGTIIRTKSGKDFPTSKLDWEFRIGILDKIAQYAQTHQIHIVTNQAGIDKGYISPVDFSFKIDNIIKEISAFILLYEKSYFNSFITDHIRVNSNTIRASIAPSFSSKFRKPRCEWVTEVYPNLDKKNSVMIGDASGLVRDVLYKSNTVEKVEDHSDSDKKFAENLGIGYIDIDEFLNNEREKVGT